MIIRKSRDFTPHNILVNAMNTTAKIFDMSKYGMSKQAINITDFP